MMGKLRNMEEEGIVEGFSTEELECMICYCPYSLGSRRPKVLECCHRLCAKCLAKILDLGESPPNAVVCPFCRFVTSFPGEAVGNLPDDCNLVAAGSPSSSTTTTTTTTYSSIRGSPNYMVITIMEPPPSPQDHHPYQLHSHPPGVATIQGRDYHSSSLDSMASITQRWAVWNCAARALVWVLGLLYFSSLPMGVYLLIMQKTTLGVLLVSLVPASLVMIMVYGFCQCLCHEFWDLMPHSSQRTIIRGG
uniref:E3 ubiquitin-protein ligase RNF182 n=1 Tax=Salmo trutta TaxID=8032 RepID=A0A674C3Z7_SALTR